MSDAQMTSAESSGPRHENRDANVSALVIYGIALCVILVLALVGSGLFLHLLAAIQPEAVAPAAVTRPVELPPKPRLETDPSRDLATMRQAEDTRLHSYGWVDRRAGTVRIPIDRAMDLLAAQQLGPKP